MMTRSLFALATGLLCLLGGPALGQTQSKSATIYRCGPEGRDLRDAPCSADAAASRSSLDYDEPSAAQRTAATQRAQAERQAADAQQAARLKREAEERQHAARATGIHGRGEAPASAASANKAGSKKPPKPGKAPKTPKAPKAPKPASLPASKVATDSST